MGDPKPLIFVIAIYYVAAVLIGISGVSDLLGEQPDFSKPTSSNVPIIGGVIDGILGVVNTIWTFIKFSFGILTFGIEGIPGFVRLGLNTIIWGWLGWDIASLIRGGS